MTGLKETLLWLRDVDSTALQSSLKDLDAAYQNFFRRVRQKEKPGYPRFTSKHDNRQSYKSKFVGTTFKVFDKAIRRPKLGKVRCRISKQVKGRILSATVSQSPGGKYFVSLCCTDVEIERLPSTGAVVGADMGIRALAITSDGVEYPIHKFPTELVRSYDIICIEDLALGNMVKNHKLVQSISDAGWGELHRRMEYKASWYGKTIVVIDRFFPSRQLCSHCGFQWFGTKDLAVRNWTCPQCGMFHDRDINAAVHIKNEEPRLLA